MAKLTISEALGWKQILAGRYAELVRLRDQNSNNERHYLGGGPQDKTIEKTPTYDVKALDKLITRIAREQRLLDQALKNTNATITVTGYDQDDSVLGELA